MSSSAAGGPGFTLGLRVPHDVFAQGELAGFVAAAETAGIDRLCVGDHVSFHGGRGYDGLVQATAIAVLGSHIEVQTAVYLLALRHPVAVARQVASLAELAPGRFVFGVGIGGEDRHEYEVCGVDPARRGRRTDEALPIVRSLLAGDEVTFAGDDFEVSSARVLPAANPAVPVVVGGRSEAALRRAGRFSEGWLGVWLDPQRFGDSIAAVEAAGSGAGRVDVAWRHGYQLWCGFGDNEVAARPRLVDAMEGLYRIPFERFERHSPRGTPADIAAAVRPYLAAGARDINLIGVGPNHRHTIEAAAEVRRLLTTESSS